MLTTPRSQSRLKEYEIQTTPDNISTRLTSARKQQSIYGSANKEKSVPSSVNNEKSANSSSVKEAVKSAESFEVMSLSELGYTKPNGEFDYEQYFETEKKKQKSAKYHVVEKPVELPPIKQFVQKDETNDSNDSTSDVKKVKQRSAVQMINDLTHLNSTNEPNVCFNFGENRSVSVHSLILLVRSAWFRRSWRMLGDLNNTDLIHEYDFNYRSEGKYEFEREIDISLESEVPRLVSDAFDFQVRLCSEDQNLEEFIEAFKQFKQFLYRGDCVINNKNSKYLMVLSEAFKVDSLKIYLSTYFKRVISNTDIDGLIRTVQLAHVYKIDDLKELCIELINKNSILVVNAASWKRLAAKYPKLVFEIFRKN